MHTMTFDIQGMTCGGCLGSVQRALGQLDGVSSVGLSLKPGTAIVQADPARVTPVQIESAIAGLGFEAKVRAADASEKAAS